MEKRWQWISERFGPMGWFTAEQKRKSRLTGGHWRKVSAKEAQSFYRSVGRLAHEQA